MSTILDPVLSNVNKTDHRDESRRREVPDCVRKSAIIRAEGSEMPKGYWVVMYRSVSDTARLAEYAPRARQAITAGGGRFVARASAAHAHEAGLVARTVIIEFDSVDAAEATYQSEAYQAALRWLDGVAERDVRIVEGVDASR